MIKEVTIESLAYRGPGVGRVDGKVWFVPFTCPGDLVKAEAVKEKKNFIQAELLEVIKPSADRIQPICPLFSRCGGCHWQMTPYEKQLEAKKSILIGTLGKAGIGINGKDLEIIPSPSEWGYRNRIQMRLTDRGLPGFYRSNSRKVVEASDCLIADSSIREEIAELYKSAESGRENLKNRFPDGFEIRVSEEGAVSVRSLSSGKDESADFSQINREVNLILRQKVSEAYKETGAVKSGILDLYCGDGNLSLYLAEEAGTIYGWDGSVPAIKRARQTVKEMTFPSSVIPEYHQGYIEKNWKTILRQTLEVETIILDPPRRGIKGLEEKIGKTDVKNIIYVSCSPPSLARDLKSLENYGYSLKKIVMLDMFPQTYHVETLVRLEKV